MKMYVRIMKSNGKFENVRVEKDLTEKQVENKIEIMGSIRGKLKAECASSRYLNGGDFTPGGLTWVMLHKVNVIVIDDDDLIAQDITFKSPYLELIEERFN